MNLNAVVEAIIFAAPETISLDELTEIIQKELEEITKEQVLNAIDEIKNAYQSDKHGIELIETGMGFSFVSKKSNYPFILKYIERIQRKRLSRSALETLSIIAFNQDCTKTDIEQIRGVSADYAIDKLVERELIEISGRLDTLGQPLTYRTTDKFLDYFGLMSIEDLPKLEIKSNSETEIGLELDENSK